MLLAARQRRFYRIVMVWKLAWQAKVYLTRRAAAGIQPAMPPAPLFRTLAETAETLIIALAGGAAFALAGFPAGLISGSVLAVAAAALIGRPVRVPVPLARACYVLIGILLGAVVTPQTLNGIVAWPVSIALVMIATLGMLIATTTYLRVVHRWDPLSALMGASPGSMTQVIALSTELGADLPAIAIVQTMRVLLLTTGIPAGLALFGLVAPALPVARGGGGSSLTEIAIVVAVSTAGAIALWRLRFPAGLLFGAMVGSGVLHGFGLVQAVLPWWVGSAGVLVLGALVGSRFASITFRLLLGYLGAAFGSFAVSASVATAFALIVAHFFPFPIANVTVAFAPGAQDTMMVLALALHLDPVFVAAHHVARFVVTAFSIALAARWMAGDRKR
jgi:membrane AbrB-like protein